MSELPRKLPKRSPLNVGMADLDTLLGVYYFIKDEMLENDTLNHQGIAVCKQKLTEIRSEIERNVFGENVKFSKAMRVEGTKPEDIDLSKFEDEKGEE